MVNNKLALLFILPSLSDIVSAGVVGKSQVERRSDVPICGGKGYDRGVGNFDYTRSPKYASYTGCSAHCLANDTCKSFGYSGQECMLFDAPLKDNFDVDDSSDDIYYDRGCTSSPSAALPSGPVKTSSSAPSSTKTGSSSSTVQKTSSSLSATSSSTPLAGTPSLTSNPPSSKASSLSAPSGSAGSSSLTTVASVLPFSAAATKAVSTGTSSTSSAASTVSIPADCAPYLTTSYQLSSLTWFNSTNNLDCVDGGRQYGPDAKVCVNTATNTLCDPSSSSSSSSSCTCMPYCTPTAPSAAFQPPGFGPPDTITIAIAGWQYPSCTQANPMTPATGIAALPLAPVGDGNVDCGPKHNYLNFFGRSDPGREQGRILFIPGSSCRGHQALFEATFPLTCTRDAGGNATCVPRGPVTIPLTRFSTAQCGSCAGSQIQ